MVRIVSTSQGGLERADLSGDEQKLLNVALERGLEDTRTEGGEVITEKLREYKSEIRVAAEVAKAQTSKGFGGQQTNSDNNFIIDRIYSGYFGFDDWDVELNGLASGATADWVHEGQTIQGDGTSGSGTSGNPVTVGNEAVHLICGIGSHSPSPKVNRVRFTLNDVPKTAITTDEEFRKTDLQVKWLDSPVLLSGEDEVLTEVFAGVGGDESLYYEGVTFLANKEARDLDPDGLRDLTSTDTEAVISL